jgi:hypothetical protein
MPADATAEYRVVIYLCGTEDTQLDDAERRCREYASRFGWLILESIRDHDAGIRLNRLLSKVNALGAHIIVTDTLEMISSHQDTRDDLTMVTDAI